MITLGIILMFLGGYVFFAEEQGNCLLLLLGMIINFTGIVVLISTFSKKDTHMVTLSDFDTYC